MTKPIAWLGAAALAVFAPLAFACVVFLPGTDVRGIYIHPKNPEVIYAGTTQGLYQSRDRGGSWTEVPKMRGWIYAFAFDFRDPDKFFVSRALRDIHQVGVYATSDGGKSFRSVTRGLADPRYSNAVPAITSLAVDPNKAMRVIAGSEDSGSGFVFVSENGAESWHLAYSGRRIWSLAFDAGLPDTIYAADEDELLVSSDAGVTWTQRHASLKRQYGFYPFERLTFPRSGARAYAVVAQELFRSDDSARSFHRINGCSRFAVAPSNPDILFAGCGAGDMCFGATALLKSSDGGKTWEGLSESVGWTLAIDPHDANIVYVGSPWGGLRRSLDGGKSWTWADQGMPIDPKWQRARSSPGSLRE